MSPASTHIHTYHNPLPPTTLFRSKKGVNVVGSLDPFPIKLYEKGKKLGNGHPGAARRYVPGCFFQKLSDIRTVYLFYAVILDTVYCCVSVCTVSRGFQTNGPLAYLLILRRLFFLKKICPILIGKF